MDVSKAIITHLKNSGLRAHTIMPTNPTYPCVTAVRSGGGGSQFMEQARYSVHTWAKSESEAYRLGMEVAHLMFDLPEAEVNISYVEQNSFYSNTYTDGTPRWTGVYIITSNR